MIISDFFAKFAAEYYIVRIFEVFHGANPNYLSRPRAVFAFELKTILF